MHYMITVYAFNGRTLKTLPTHKLINVHGPCQPIFIRRKDWSICLMLVKILTKAIEITNYFLNFASVRLRSSH